jgi:hypothetical protein
MDLQISTLFQVKILQLEEKIPFLIMLPENLDMVGN